MNLKLYYYQLGLATKERYEKYQNKKGKIQELNNQLATLKFKPVELNPFLEKLSTAQIKEGTNLFALLKRSDLSFETLLNFTPIAHLKNIYSSEIIEQVEIQIKYQSYIDKEKSMVVKMKSMENLTIPAKFDYSKIKTLSTESRIKLEKIRPETVGQASRISGVSASDISILLIHMGR